MGFELDRKKMYTMPVGFGPTPGMMQNADGRRFLYGQLRHVTNHTLVYESNPAQLEKLLPPAFTLDKPFVIVNHRMNRNLAWLAGRGYNLVSVTIPATFHGKKETVKGCFMVAIWENEFDPILAGREQLGYVKTFAAIDDIVTYNDVSRAYASSYGFQFVRLKFHLTRQPDNVAELKSILFDPENQGDMNYRYIPKTGDGFTAADVECITLNPSKIKYPDDVTATLPEPVVTYGTGWLKWNRPEFEDMPTQYHIIQGLDDMEIRRFVGAVRVDTANLADCFDVRVIE